ncbi:hypothetical protein G6F23_012607 [Rhizopus arrhizus]|nr:hypothetical protein G6F23_012607 [Rhizopus arrhizus]
MLGLHFFMPAHLVPLVEVVLGEASDNACADSLIAFMRRCGSVPVKVKQDLPGFLANRLQHALSREAFDLIDRGIASPEDVDAAVRFGFGFRFLAAGPVMQRDHAGIDVHAAAGATMYPTFCNSDHPARCLTERAADGRYGMKAGEGPRTAGDPALNAAALPRAALAESPVIITVAPNGAYKKAADHPAVPMTPEALALEARACLDAGAGMMHLHVRKPAGRHLLCAHAYREALAAVARAVGRERLVQVTSEAAGVYKAAEQIALVRELQLAHGKGEGVASL